MYAYQPGFVKTERKTWSLVFSNKLEGKADRVMRSHYGQKQKEFFFLGKIMSKFYCELTT